MGCGRPKLAMVHFNERLPEILEAKLVIACHDELVVECPKEQADEVARFLGGSWSPGWTRFSTLVWIPTAPLGFPWRWTSR